MSDSSGSTRKSSFRKLIIFVIILVILIAGSSLYAYIPSSTSQSQNSTTGTSSTITTSSTSGMNTSESASSSTTSTTSSSTSSNHINTTSSNAELYKIQQSELRTWFRNQGLNSSEVSLVPSPTAVPYYLVQSNSSTVGLLYLDTDVAPRSCYGFESYIETLALVNTTGNIENLTVYRDLDPYSGMITQTWLNTYINRSVFEPLIMHQDAQPVTGATYSSTGIINGTRDAGRIVVDDYEQYEGLSVQQPSSSVSVLAEISSISSFFDREFGLQPDWTVFVLIALFAAAVIAFELKSNRIRYGVYAGSIIFIGFCTARMVTIGDYIDFTSRIFPPFWNDLYWYALYGGVLITSLFWGRFYCGYLCPFGTFTELLNKISPVKLTVPYKYTSKLRYIKYVILAVVVFEILQGTILYQVEPFGTLFVSTGDTFDWIFLALIIGVSLFLNRFYCTYICPAGAGLALLSWFRVRNIKRWPECNKCMICANQCPRQAIKGGHISPLECMDCRDCEKNYLNTKICPHYALERTDERKSDDNVLLN